MCARKLWDKGKEKRQQGRDRGDGLPVLRRFDSGHPELHGKRDDAGARLQGGGTVPDCAEADGNGVSSEIMQESKPIGCL